jgi:hypothetical protein
VAPWPTRRAFCAQDRHELGVAKALLCALHHLLAARLGKINASHHAQDQEDDEGNLIPVINTNPIRKRQTNPAGTHNP